nr:hypothetical protein C1892_02030 [Pseudomonas sp. MPBD7-1]
MFPKTTVGANLLAIAVCQSASIMTDRPLSRASSLPRGPTQISRSPRAWHTPASATCCLR